MEPSIWRLRAGCFSQFFATGILVTYEAVWMKTNGLGESVIGVILGGATFLAFLCGFGWARLSDRTGKAEIFVRTGFFAFACILAVLPLCDELPEFLLYAAARSLAFPLFTALLPHLAVKALSRSGPAGSNFAGYRIWGSFGFITATLIVPTLAPNVPWIFWSASIILVIGAALLSRIEVRDAGQTESAADPPPLLRLPLALFLLAAMIHTLAIPVCFPFLSVYARDLGGSTEFIGLLSASNGILAVISLPFVGRWVDRFGVRYILLAAIIAQPLRTFAYSLIDQPGALLLPQLLHPFTFACFEVAGVLLVSRLVGPERGAMAQALLLGARTIGILLGSLLTGFLFEHLGPPATYRIIALLCLLAIPVYLPLLKLMGPRGTIAAQTDLRSNP